MMKEKLVTPFVIIRIILVNSLAERVEYLHEYEAVNSRGYPDYNNHINLDERANEYEDIENIIYLYFGFSRQQINVKRYFLLL